MDRNHCNKPAAVTASAASSTLRTDPLTPGQDPGFDAGRRTALKVSGAVAAGGAAALASGPLTAAARLFATPDITAGVSAFDKPLNEFIVEVQHRWESNDIALVIRNRGVDAATITHMTPARIELARGSLDLSSVLVNGPVTLAGGEEIIVPLQRHRGNRISGVNNVSVLTSVGHFDRSLQHDLKQRMSIVTDGNALAAVTVAPGPRIA